MKKILNTGYGSIHGCFWMYYSIISSFCSVFLLARGFSDAEIGVVFSVGNILAAFCQPFLADFADRTKRFSLVSIIRAMAIFLLAVTAGLFFAGGSMPALFVIFVLLIAGHMALQPLINSLAFRISARAEHINFGLTRSVGSICYALLVVVLGYLIEAYGVNVIPITGELTAAMLIAGICFTGYMYKKALRSKSECTQNHDILESEHSFENKKSEPESINLIRFAKRNKLFILLNIGVVGLFFSNSVLNNYMIQIVNGVGGDSSDLGIVLCLMATLEIPPLILFDRIRMSFSCQSLLKIGAIGFTVKMAAIWLADSVTVVLLAQGFQLVAFGLFYPAMVHFINDTMSKGEAVKGQALFTTMTTSSTVLASFIGGLLLDISGPEMLCFGSTLASAIGMVIVVLIVSRIRNLKNYASASSIQCDSTFDCGKDQKTT